MLKVFVLQFEGPRPPGRGPFAFCDHDCLALPRRRKANTVVPAPGWRSNEATAVQRDGSGSSRRPLQPSVVTSQFGPGIAREFRVFVHGPFCVSAQCLLSLGLQVTISSTIQFVHLPICRMVPRARASVGVISSPHCLCDPFPIVGDGCKRALVCCLLGQGQLPRPRLD